jgi:hypothetical protein
MKHSLLAAFFVTLFSVTVKSSGLPFAFKLQNNPGDTVLVFADKKADATMPVKEAKAGYILACMAGTEMGTVQSFKMSIVKGGWTKSAVSTSNRLSTEQVIMLARINGGSKIIFSDVKVKFKDGSIKAVKAGTYTIT